MRLSRDVRLRVAFLLGFLLLLVAALRFYRLDSAPAGLNVDEAAEGILALQILAGARPVFFSAYTGQEAGFLYLVAASVAMLGRTILAVRLPAALLGVLLIPAVALLARRLVPPWAALAAAGMLVAAPWLQHLNRIGFRANLLPFAMALWGFFLLRALDQGRRRDWLAAGVLLGVTAYTYLASRFVPVLVACFLLYLLIWQRPLLRRSAMGLGLMLLVAGLLALPLVWHFIQTPSDWNARTGQVWVCADQSSWLGCVGRIGEHGLKTLAMFGLRGDPKAFYNLDAGPALPWLLGWLWYPGIVLALWRWRDPRWALMLLWVAVMCLPGILSSESPSFIRTLGAVPAAALLWVLPLVVIAETVARRWPRLDWEQSRWAFVSVGVISTLLAAITAWGYFGRWASDPERYYDYNAYAVDTAQALADMPPEVTLYLSEEYYRHATYLFLVPRTDDAHWFDGRAGWPLAALGNSAAYVIPYTTPLDPAFVAPFVAGGQGTNASNASGQYSFSRFDFTNGSPEVAPATPLQAQLGPLQIEGITLQREDERWRVTLFCRVLATETRDLRFFAHVVDAQGTLITQHDAIGYSAPEWQTGERFVNFQLLDVPESAASPQLRLGLYDSVSGERLPATGQAAVGDALVLPLKP